MWLAIEPVKPQVEFGDILMPGVMLAGAILLAAIVLMLLKRWRSTAETFDSPHDQLAEYRRMYEQGELSREEFDRIHALLTQRIRSQVGGTGVPGSLNTPEQPPRPAASESGAGPASSTEAAPEPPDQPPSGSFAGGGSSG